MYSLGVNNEEVVRYLGIRDGKLDTDTEREIQEAVDALKRCVEYKIEYRVFDIEKRDGAIDVAGTSLRFSGKAIQDLLQDCEQCILLAVTLGHKVDTLLRTLQVKNISSAVVTDFCASSMVEHLCNQVEDELRDRWNGRSLYLTDRFSPGYGDLPIAVQSKLCEVLDASRKMGLHVTSSGIMIPKKSITAILGIAEKKQRMKIKGCKYCDFYENCEYRKGGQICD